MKSSDYRVVAVVREGGDVQQPVLAQRLSPQEVNLLFVLCEHANRVIGMDDLCHRLKVSVTGVRIIASRLRKKLSREWTIHTVSNQGMQILYFGGKLAEAERTFIEIDPEAVKVHRQHSEASRQRMREFAIRTES